MKHLLITALIYSLLGCGSHNNSKAAVGGAGIPAAIVGAWEIDSMSMGGRFMKPDRPNPNNPFVKRNTSDWTQLKIDGRTLALISTDFVDYTIMELPYKIEGREIITIDEKNFSMTDFVVHGFTQNTLTLEFVSKGGDNTPGMRWNFKRINENALATKTAQSVTFKQSVLATVEQTGQKALQVDKPAVSRVKFSQLGLVDSIRCSINNEGNLQFTYSVLEVKKDSVGSSSEFDGVSYDFKNLRPDLNGPQKNSVSKSAVAVSVRSSGRSFYNDLKTCEHQIARKGAALNIKSVCTSDNGQARATVDATCLLIHSMW